MMLVSLEQAKAHLRMDHDFDDSDITLKIEGASAAVLDYLKDYADSFLDSNGEVIEDSNGNPDVPYQVKAATLLMLGDLYANREPIPTDPVDAQYGYGYLPRAVIALLYPLREPTIA